MNVSLCQACGQHEKWPNQPLTEMVSAVRQTNPGSKRPTFKFDPMLTWLTSRGQTGRQNEKCPNQPLPEMV